MMRPTLFSRLMLVFAAVTVLCFSLLSGVFYITLRDVQVRARMDALRLQAYDIAYLAATLQVRSAERLMGGYQLLREALGRKLRYVYDEYSAYCMVVDRNGNGTAYFLSILEENQHLKAAFDKNNLIGTLRTVVSGQEVIELNNTAAGPMFTVAVPWERGGRVLGAVYIQTAAQTVRASYESLGVKIAAVSLLAFLSAGVVVFLYTRRFVRPLRQMSTAAAAMASGRFSQRVSEEGTRELHDLASAFNTMSEKLKHTEKIRREFIANLSHELRSPMTSIQGFVQGMADGTIPGEESAHYLKIIQSETQRMTRLIARLLSLTRLENEDIPLTLSDFDINELVRLVLITKMPAMEEKQILLQPVFDQDPCWVRADRDQIEQVLINLVDNALRFTPEGGTISLKTRPDGIGTVTVTVSDSGPGIPPEDAPFIFERFYKADKAHSAGQGTGLGLAICRMILERHGQGIRLLPTRSGAAFAFTLAQGKPA